MNRQPVTIAAAVTALLISTVDFLQLVGILNFDAEQLAGLHLIVTNFALAGGAIVARAFVTPVNSPRDNDGNPFEVIPGYLNE